MVWKFTYVECFLLPLDSNPSNHLLKFVWLFLFPIFLHNQDLHSPPQLLVLPTTTTFALHLLAPYHRTLRETLLANYGQVGKLIFGTIGSDWPYHWCLHVKRRFSHQLWGLAKDLCMWKQHRFPCFREAALRILDASSRYLRAIVKKGIRLMFGKGMLLTPMC